MINTSRSIILLLTILVSCPSINQTTDASVNDSVGLNLGIESDTLLTHLNDQLLYVLVELKSICIDNRLEKKGKAILEFIESLLNFQAQGQVKSIHIDRYFYYLLMQAGEVNISIKSRIPVDTEPELYRLLSSEITWQVNKNIIRLNQFFKDDTGKLWTAFNCSLDDGFMYDFPYFISPPTLPRNILNTTRHRVEDKNIVQS